MARVLLHLCTGCHEYTLQTDKCPSCGGKVEAARPAKFSPEDHYGDYRRRLKKMERDARGWSAAAGQGDGTAGGGNASK